MSRGELKDGQLFTVSFNLQMKRQRLLFGFQIYGRTYLNLELVYAGCTFTDVCRLHLKSILSWHNNLNFKLFLVSVDNAGLHKRNLWCLNKG